MIGLLATNDYLSAVSIMPPIVAGVYLTAVSNMYSNVLIYYKKTSLIMVSAVVAALSNVLLNLVLIPRFGFQSAAYSTLISFVILAVLQFAGANRVSRAMGRVVPVYCDRSVLGVSAAGMAVMMLAIPFYHAQMARLVVVLTILVLGALIAFASRARARR